MLTLKKNKPNLKEMFDKFIEQEEIKEKRLAKITDNRYAAYLLGRYMSPSEDDDDFDVNYNIDFNFEDGYSKSKKAWKRAKQQLGDFLNNTKKGKKNKKETRRGNKKNKKKYNPLQEAIEDPNNRIIYFYRDIDNPDRAEIYFNLHDFDEFLQKEGIEMSDDEVNAIINRETSFCTINPDVQKTNGTVQLISDSSYGGLYWACHEDEDIYSNCGSF